MILFRFDNSTDYRVIDYSNNCKWIKDTDTEKIYLTNLHLGELQKLTDIPLKEITFDELLNL